MSDAPSYIAAHIAQYPQFNLRCQIIAIQYAVNVVLPESTSTTNYAARRVFAVKVIAEIINATALARIVLTDPYIQAAAIADAANFGMAVADANIDGRIQATWDSLSTAAV